MAEPDKEEDTGHDGKHGRHDGKRLLSPTQITSYLDCPRKWYYQYVLRLPVPEKFALVRGTVVHSVCEQFFRWKPAPGWSYDELVEHMTELAYSLLKDFWAEEKVTEKFGPDRYDETKAMVDRFLQLRKWKMEPLYEKYKDASKAWNYTKPKSRERHVLDEELGIQGYIDAVIETEPGEVVLVDYKTSSFFKHPLSHEHEIQLSIYALLFEKETGVRPMYVSIEYLLYGQVVNYPITADGLDKMRTLIQETYKKTGSKDISDYPPNTEYKFCKWCDFRETCQGQKPIG
jgi:CRISPR/Cas system-associated exonuclease Cas4 (RecB family)